MQGVRKEFRIKYRLIQTILVGGIVLVSMFRLMTPTTIEYTAPSPLKVEQVQVGEDYIKSQITFYSNLYQVSEAVMNAVVACESNYNPNALGDGGQSKGLVQIHIPAHPSISNIQAFDVEFSLNFLAENLSKGNGNMWTCYRNLYNR